MAQLLAFNHYNFVSHLGCGFSADVELLQQKYSGQLFALKVFKAKQSMLYENEKKMMEELSECPGVIQIASQPKLNSNSNEDPNKFILMEYAQQGNMLEFLQKSPLPEPISRAYFRQLLQILENIHKRNIVHRDIKLENLLLDEEFHLKVCDFGFAAKFMDQQGKKIKMNEHVGTTSTAAPELYSVQPYSGVEADLFQIGVVLFQICTGSAPFKSANIKEDQIYQLIQKNQLIKFWNFHESRLGQGYFSKELKNLLQKLLAYNPNQRLSIAEVFEHLWMKESDASMEEIVSEMKRRTIKLTEKSLEIMEKQQETSQLNTQLQGTN